MPLKYRLIPKINPRQKDDPKKFYTKAIHTDKIDLKGLSQELSRVSSLSIGDVYSVITLLVDTISRLAGDGKIISLGDLGSFYAEILSEGAESEEAFHPKLIKKIKLRFHPGKDLRKELNRFKIEKA